MKLLFQLPTPEEAVEDNLQEQKRHHAKFEGGKEVQLEYFDRAGEIGNNYEENRKLDLECTIQAFADSIMMALGETQNDMFLLINNKSFDKA